MHGIADLSAAYAEIDILHSQRQRRHLHLTTLLVGHESAQVFTEFLIEIGEYEIRVGVNSRWRMTISKCTQCGRTESEVTADARTLGLLPEFECGAYSCCQIVEWADEQWLAWFEATQEDNKRVDDSILRPEFGEDGLVLVPVRLRRRQVPWYRNPDALG